jgi:orotate phosphoribosyltransferase
MSLFNLGSFRLHSGENSDFKIDCDYLSHEDIEALCYILHKKIPEFSHVYGVPRGGLILEKELRKYCRPLIPNRILVIDDVLTTGDSILTFMDKFDPLEVMGATLFRRSSQEVCPNIYSLINIDV